MVEAKHKVEEVIYTKTNEVIVKKTKSRKKSNFFLALLMGFIFFLVENIGVGIYVGVGTFILLQVIDTMFNRMKNEEK